MLSNVDDDKSDSSMAAATSNHVNKTAVHSSDTLAVPPSNTPPHSPILSTPPPRQRILSFMNGHSQQHEQLSHEQQSRVKEVPQLNHSDLAIIDSALVKYSELLQSFMRQFWKGDEQWQILAHGLYQKMIHLQFILTNDAITEHQKIKALQELMRDVNGVINQCSDAGNANTWVNKLFGIKQFSLKTILLDFKNREGHQVDIILMKFEKGFTDHHMIERLTNASNIMQQIKENLKGHQEIETIEAFEQRYCNSDQLIADFKAFLTSNIAAEFQEDWDSPNLNNLFEWFKSSRKDVVIQMALLQRLKKNYPGARVTDALEREFQKLYTEFLKFPPPIVGLWLPLALEMGALLTMMVDFTYPNSNEKLFSQHLSSKLSSFNQLVFNEGIPAYPEEENYYEINQLLLIMKTYVTRMCDSENVAQPLAVASEKLFHEWYERAMGFEQGYIVQEHTAHPDEVQKYIWRARLLAIYEICFYFINMNFNDYYNEAFKLLIPKIQAQAYQVDHRLSAYRHFLNNKEFENISSIITQQRRILTMFTEQYWQFDKDGKVIAEKVELQLEIFQKVIDDKHASVLNRLVAASEVFDLFNEAIQLQVGNDLKSLKQSPVMITEALQLIDLREFASKVSLDDICAVYRQKGYLQIQESIKNITLRLSTKERRLFVYQTHFRYIYYQLCLYVEGRLNEFIKTQKLNSEVVTMARELMNTLMQRAKKIKGIYHNPADLPVCIREAKAILGDFNKAIIAFMNNFYKEKLSFQRQQNKAEKDPEIRSIMSAKIDELQDELYYGTVKSRLVESVRLAVKNLELYKIRAKVFVEAILVRASLDKNIRMFLLKSDVLSQTLTPVIESIFVETNYRESYENISEWESAKFETISTQISSWIKSCYPEAHLASDVERLSAIMNGELKRILSNITKRHSATIKTEEAIVQFFSDSNKDALLAVALAWVQRIDDLGRREATTQLLKKAAENYAEGLLENERDILWNFAVKHQKTDISEFPGILLAFKRDDEIFLKSWINVIETEQKSQQEDTVVIVSVPTEMKSPATTPDNKPEHKRHHSTDDTAYATQNGVASINPQTPANLYSTLNGVFDAAHRVTATVKTPVTTPVSPPEVILPPAAKEQEPQSNALPTAGQNRVYATAARHTLQFSGPPSATVAQSPKEKVVKTSSGRGKHSLYSPAAATTTSPKRNTRVASAMDETNLLNITTPLITIR